MASGLLTEWTNTSTLPFGLASNSLFTYHNYIYLMAGSNFNVPENALYSTSDIFGELSSWTDLLPKPPPRFWNAYAQTTNNYYLLGGTTDSIINTDQVLLGKLQSFNQITWETATSLPSPLALGSSVITGNKIYYAGGNQSPSFDITDQTNQNIYFAGINPDGTIGNWSIAGQLPSQLIGLGLIAHNSYIYVIGGKNGEGITNKVSRARINSDGTIDSNWENLPPLPVPLWRSGITIYNNMIFVAGGQTSGDSIVSNVYYSTIDQDNKFSVWESGPDLPFPNCCSPLVSLNGYLYLVGGHDGNNYTERVLKSKILLETPSPTSTPTPTASPTPYSTPTVSPTITPSPSNVNKIIFLPGMGASWNLNSFINCKTNSNDNWTMAPYAEGVYENLLNQLPTRGWKVILFNYDWRNDIRKNSLKLKNFIDSNDANEKINIVAHSMGGLIARNYIEENKGGQVAKIIMAGTPNRGSALSYPLFAKGQIWAEDLIEKVAVTLFVNHCGIPESAQNLLPIDDYLKNIQTKQYVDINSMLAKNNYLPTDFVYPAYNLKVGTLAGNGQKTLKNIIVNSDKSWPDGRPVSKETTNEGDGTVTVKSVYLDNAHSNLSINQTHSGIIGTTEGINKILDFLGSPGIEDPPYTEPKSALIVIGYPDNFWLTDKKGNTFQSKDGMIAIINPTGNQYELGKLTSAQETTLVIGEFFKNGNVKYKEYKYKSGVSTTKMIFFDDTDTKGEILKELIYENKKLKEWYLNFFRKLFKYHNKLIP